jgi:serine/threonine-protein kinase
VRRPVYESYGNLGAALASQGKLAEAVATYREVLRLKPDLPVVHYNLGNALQQQGNFRAALDSLRKAHELGACGPGWPSARSAAFIHQVERLLELDRDLPAFLRGTRRPSGPGEQVELAYICRHPAKRLYAASARYYADAFAAQRALAENLFVPHRYNAACSAALAGAGRGEDAGRLDCKVRIRLRRQALDWLRADLAAWAKLVNTDNPQACAAAVRILTHWERDPDLEGVRDTGALKQLPEDEREAWRKPWAEVTDLRKRAGGK